MPELSLASDEFKAFLVECEFHPDFIVTYERIGVRACPTCKVIMQAAMVKRRVMVLPKQGHTLENTWYFCICPKCEAAYRVVKGKRVTAHLRGAKFIQVILDDAD